MTKDEFERELDIIQNKGRIIEIINNKEISIDWETDISKIDLSVLRSFRNRKIIQPIQCIETHKLLDVTPCQFPLFNNGGSDGHLIIELVELMRKGVKIIPPIFEIKITTKNGVEQSVSALSFVDGMHRLRIANALGLIEIPIVIINKYRRFYSFSNNNIKATDDGLIIKSALYDHFYNYEQNHKIEIDDEGIIFDEY